MGVRRRKCSPAHDPSNMHGCPDGSALLMPCARVYRIRIVIFWRLVRWLTAKSPAGSEAFSDSWAARSPYLPPFATAMPHILRICGVWESIPRSSTGSASSEAVCPTRIGFSGVETSDRPARGLHVWPWPRSGCLASLHRGCASRPRFSRAIRKHHGRRSVQASS